MIFKLEIYTINWLDRYSKLQQRLDNYITHCIFTDRKFCVNIYKFDEWDKLHVPVCIFRFYRVHFWVTGDL